MRTAFELRQDRHTIAQEMNTIITGATPDMARWKQLDEKQESLRKQIDAVERTESLNRELETVSNAERPNVPGAPAGSAAATPYGRSKATRSTDDYKYDFENFLLTREESPRLKEARALVAASSTLIPQGFEDELIVKRKAWGGMLRVCRIINTSSGNPLPWPNADDTGNTGEWLTEASPVTNADPSFSNVILNAYKLSSKQVKFSVEIEQDTAFPLTTMLIDMFARRMGVTANAAFTIGDGTSTYGTITGLIPALVTAGGRSVLAIGANTNSGNSGDTALNSIGTDDLSNLITQVDPAYRTHAKFVGNQAAWDKLRTLKDKYGRPIWNVSLAVGVPDTILGYGYDWNQDMDVVGAGKKSVVFGDFSNYVIRNVLGLTVVLFNELYMANHQRAAQAFARMDGKLLQASAFAYLQHPLS